jgi:hypothetical protein
MSIEVGPAAKGKENGGGEGGGAPTSRPPQLPYPSSMQGLSIFLLHFSFI